VYFGAWVHLDSGQGSPAWYRLVGPDEFDMASGYISMDSPLGSSLMGKRLDDEITVALPGGNQTFTVIAIRYGPPP
jgi:transcription elongation factor GreB